MISSLGASPSYPRLMAGGPAPTPPVLAPATGAAPALTPAGPAPAGTDWVQSLSSFATSAFKVMAECLGKAWDWMKSLFGHATPLTTDEQTIATKYGLLATSANVAAFKAEVQGYSQNGTLGPGVQNPDAVRQLQMALTRLGQTVQVSGTYDAATSQAVTQFKMSAGLHQTYLAANGSPAVNEYATPDVIAEMLRRIQPR